MWEEKSHRSEHTAVISVVWRADPCGAVWNSAVLIEYDAIELESIFHSFCVPRENRIPRNLLQQPSTTEFLFFFFQYK
jgi:hypothetical protein